MILGKIRVIHRYLFGGTLFLQPTRQQVYLEGYPASPPQIKMCLSVSESDFVGSLLIILRKIAQAQQIFENRELTRIASQVFFEMDSYVMILVKIV
jgi:hypothetical protein